MNSPKEIANNYIAIGKGEGKPPVAKMFEFLGITGPESLSHLRRCFYSYRLSIPLASVGKFLGHASSRGLTMVLSLEVNCSCGNCLPGYSALQKRNYLLAEC